MISPIIVIEALFFLIVQSLFVSIRWGTILERYGKNIPYLEIVKMHYISLGSSLFLPNIIAEPALKSVLMKKYHVDITTSLSSVFIDKLFVIIGLFIMSLFVMPIIMVLYNTTYSFQVAYLSFVFSLVLVYILLIAFKYKILNKIIESIAEKYKKFLVIFKYLIFDRTLVIKCIVITFLSQVSSITAFYILSSNMGLPLSYYDCLFLLPPAMLATTIPVAFNGWGIREISIIYMELMQIIT